MPSGFYIGNQGNKFCRRGHYAWRYFRDGSRRVCKACQALWVKRNPKSTLALTLRAQAKRKNIINKLKSVPCMDCKVQYPAYVMDFDHIDSTNKVDNIASMFMHSLPKVLIEIEKCEVVCSNCHRIRTYNRHKISKEIQHV